MDPKSPPPFRKRPILTPDSPIPASPRKAPLEGDNTFKNVVLPKGNKLIVRGAYSADDGTHDPIALIQASVDKISQKDPTLKNAPVAVVPFSDRFPNVAVAYVVLSPIFNSPDPDDEPRCDLLDQWRTALQDENPRWEVAWAPAAEGTDKRMWLRFPTVVTELGRKLGRDATKDEIVKCIHDVLKANSMAVDRVFTMGQPIAAAGAVLIHPRDVDTLLRQRSINTYTFLPERLQVDRTKQVEVLNPFELVITGISAYENVEPYVHDYLNRFTDDDGTTLAGWRTPAGYRDLFVFHMTSWDATRRVIADHGNFKSVFEKFTKLTAPELVVSLNDGTVAWRTSSSVSEEAGKLGAQLEQLTRRFDQVERDVGLRLDTTHSLLANVQKSTLLLTERVTDLANVQQHTNLTLTAMQQEVALTRAKAPLEAAEASLRMLMMLGGTDQEKEDARANIAVLKKEKDLIDAKIAEVQGTALALPPPPPRVCTSPPSTPPGICTSSTRHSRPSTPFSTPRSSPNATARTTSRPSTPTPNSHRDTSTTPTDNKNKKRRISATSEIEEGEIRQLVQPDEDTNMVDASSGVRRHRLSRPTRLMAARIDSPVDVRMPTLTHRYTRGPDGTRGFHARKRLNVVGESDTSRHRFVCRFDTSLNVPPNKAFLLLFGLFVLLTTLVQVVEATTPRSAFTMFTLNANGLVHSNKMAHISAAINHRRPHAFILNESKTNTKTSKNLPNNEYTILEEEGVPTTNHHLYKWGVVVGIRKDIQRVQRLTNLEAALKGRVIAVDLAIQTTNGDAYIHRLFGVYAPWDPGTNETKEFWPALTRLVISTTTSWSLGGDLNATVAAAERAVGGSDARDKFLAFLDAVNGHDLWTARPDRNRYYDWTSCGQDVHKNGGSIIDRFVTSKATLLDSEIYATNTGTDFVPNTNHRIVVASVIHRPPRGGRSLFVDRPVTFSKMRIKYPAKLEAHRHESFRTLMNKRVKDARLHEICVNDESSFKKLYSELGKTIITAAEDAYGRMTRFKKRDETITSEKIQKALAEVRAFGGAIRMLRGDADFSPSKLSREICARIRREFEAEEGDVSIVAFANGLKRHAYRVLFAERALEVKARAMYRDKAQIMAALRGGSTKRMVMTAEFIPLPLVIKDIDNEDLIAGAAEVKDATRRYWSNLYNHDPPPNIPKPWLDTKSVREARARVEDEPFVWPKPLQLQDLRALLRKGNARPAPGPDEWEKWVIKNLPDQSLALVMQLVNYIVMNSVFPGDVKDTTLVMFHKRGLQTDLSNWRGIFLSNFLANCPITWLNSLLTSYVAKHRILPDTQVATQQDVQTRDLMSYLAGIKCWAARQKEPVYAIKRDQMKGFDYLSPEGMYDAVRAYGLPTQIIDIDRASQTDVKCYIRTAYGNTEPITITGVNKQGGPMSPLKSTLTTSLGHHYLNDMLAVDPNALIITTASFKKADPHLPDDHLKLHVAMTEATDDSYLFATSLPSLRRNTLEMERFQFAYGWLTQWSKTVAYALQVTGTLPKTVSFDSITNQRGVDPMVVTQHDVPLIKDELDFLRAKVDDPGARYEELKSMIDAFAFPKFIGRTPITLLKKVTSQCLISRCRALLSLQPIKQKDAEELDRKIMRKIHDELGMPFTPNTKILDLPFKYHGLEFPSLARINAGIVVDGIARDLNHHISAYRTMARITLADWTCDINDCTNPIDGDGLSRGFAQYAGKVPFGWIVAQTIMASTSPRISLRMTERAEILKGEVSLSHCAMLHDRHHPQAVSTRRLLDGHNLRSLRTKGIRTVKDVGTWIKNGDMNGYVFCVKRQTFPGNWTAAARNGWTNAVNMLSRICTSSLFDGPDDLLLERNTRRDIAERMLRRYANYSNLKPSATAQGQQIWSSDGCKPAGLPTHHETLT